MEKIKSLNELYSLSLKRKAVVVPNSGPWRKPMPAAWMINLPGVVLWRLFATGMFIYIKGVK